METALVAVREHEAGRRDPNGGDECGELLSVCEKSVLFSQQLMYVHTQCNEKLKDVNSRHQQSLTRDTRSSGTGYLLEEKEDDKEISNDN